MIVLALIAVFMLLVLTSAALGVCAAVTRIADLLEAQNKAYGIGVPPPEDADDAVAEPTVGGGLL